MHPLLAPIVRPTAMTGKLDCEVRARIYAMMKARVTSLICAYVWPIRPLKQGDISSRKFQPSVPEMYTSCTAPLGHVPARRACNQSIYLAFLRPPLSTVYVCRRSLDADGRRERSLGTGLGGS